MDMYKTPTILVIFGATGDLARKKIVPALWHLFCEGKFPPDISLIGFSRRAMDTAGFRRYLGEMIAPHRGKHGTRAAREFAGLFTFVRGFFDAIDAYESLRSAIAAVEKRAGAAANKMFYLAVAPELYATVLTHLAESGLSRASRGADTSASAGWTRIVVEKPFGKDADTAQALDEMLGSLFQEDQIYRIDHYLAKEMIQNILAFRFANNLFEDRWDRETIERVEIRLWERIGVEERGSFYDGVGALRDVGQNHLLQMLALVAMERPDDFTAQSLRRCRAEALVALEAPSPDDIARSSARAQYRGYRAIAGVSSDSRTETYFRVPARLDSPRWRSVDFMLESGKRMGEQKKEIAVWFRHTTPCLCPPQAGRHFRNKIVFSLEPEERITIHFWSKKPGFAYDLEERTLSFLLREGERKTQYVEEYKKLLLDCITGDQTLFVSTEEVRPMWRFTDPIIDAWEAGAPALMEYAPDTSDIAAPEEDGGAAPTAPRRAGARPREKKDIAIIGLGKMGIAIAERLLQKGWRVAGYDRDPERAAALMRLGGYAAADLPDAMARQPHPRLAWLMVPASVKAMAGAPAGKPVDDLLFGENGLARALSRGDMVMDGGNSFYEDSMMRARKLARRGIRFLDVGVSGGPEGARQGAALMIGGKKRDFQTYEHLFRDLAAPEGYGFMGASGAGHFVKMVHNGIEYGMMQSLAEGFALLKKSPFGIDVKKAAGVYNAGSVIESRLMRWLKDAYEKYGATLPGVSGSVGHTGEGEWTVKTAQKMKIPAPVIKAAFDFRVRSKKRPSYTGKILSALRHQFGGHSVQ